MKRYRRVLCAALALVMLIPAAVWAAQRLPHLTLTPDAAAVTVGRELTVTVACGQMTVGSYTGGFTFDPAVLEAVSVTAGDAPVYGGGVCGCSTAQEANAAGSVGFYAVHPQEGTYAPGTLLTVVFRVIAPGAAELRPYEDCDGTETFAGWTGETRVVFTAAPDDTLLGDCNGDGLTNVLDMQSLYTWLATGKKEGTLDDDAFRAVADINGDEDINILDYQALYEQLCGVPRHDESVIDTAPAQTGAPAPEAAASPTEIPASETEIPASETEIPASETEIPASETELGA